MKFKNPKIYFNLKKNQLINCFLKTLENFIKKILWNWIDAKSKKFDLKMKSVCCGALKRVIKL